MQTASRSDLLVTLSRLADDLTAGDGARPTLAELTGVARALGVPTGERRDDAPVFLNGTEPIATATWTQCGGILFAIERGEVDAPAEAAARVARRLLQLAPTHR